jgi:hypothetical protein
MAEKDINLYAPNSWLEEESKAKQKAVKLPSHLRIYNQTPITDEITQKMLTPKQMFLDVDAKKIATTQHNPKRTPKGYYSELVLEIEDPETIAELYKEKARRNRQYRKDLVTEGKREFDFFKNSALVCQSTSKLFDFIMIKISETGVERCIFIRLITSSLDAAIATPTATNCSSKPESHLSSKRPSLKRQLHSLKIALYSDNRCACVSSNACTSLSKKRRLACGSPQNNLSCAGVNHKHLK